MKTIITSAVLALIAAVPASGQWEVTSQVDPMNDRVTHHAVTRNDNDAYLRYQCSNTGYEYIWYSSGKLLPIRSRQTTGITYRVDDQPSVGDSWMVSIRNPVATPWAVDVAEVVDAFISAEQRILIRDGNGDLNEFDGVGISDAVAEARTACGID